MGYLTVIDDWLHSCIRCGNCKYVFREYVPSCPSGAFFHFESYFASGRIRIAQAITENKIEWDETLLDPIFGCTTCGSCEIQCLSPHNENIVDIIEELRAQAVSALGSLPAHIKFKERVQEVHNPYGAQHHAKTLTTSLGLPQKAEYVYFIGCTSNYRETEIRDATISVLQKAGIDFTIVDEYCCSSPLLRTGQRGLVKDLAQHNVRAIRDTGAKRVVMSCSGCYRTFTRDYPRFGI
ncbi:MAG: (Fe-S)-binding protein, partial [Candidatus Thorarchaeota archaeon]